MISQELFEKKLKNAAALNKVSVLARLMQENRKVSDPDGLLMEAINHGSIECMNFLLSRGFSLSNECGLACLINGCQYAKQELVSLSLEHVRLNDKQYAEGLVKLFKRHPVAEKERLSILKFLLNKKDVSVETREIMISVLIESIGLGMQKDAGIRIFFSNAIDLIVGLNESVAGSKVNKIQKNLLTLGLRECLRSRRLVLADILMKKGADVWLPNDEVMSLWGTCVDYYTSVKDDRLSVLREILIKRSELKKEIDLKVVLDRQFPAKEREVWEIIVSECLMYPTFERSSQVYYERYARGEVGLGEPKSEHWSSLSNLFIRCYENYTLSQTVEKLNEKKLEPENRNECECIEKKKKKFNFL